MPLLDFLNGKKTVIGAILFTLTNAVAFLTTLLPGLQDLFGQLVGPTHTAQVAAVFAFLTQAFVYVGLAHKAWKSFFGLPDDPATAGKGFGRIAGVGLLAVLSAALLSSTACNSVPPNLSPAGGIAFRANQVTLSLVSLKDVTKEAETRGLISRNDAFTVLDATKTALVAANDLGHALEAGADATTAKAKAIAAIRDALDRVPGQLSPHAQEVIAPYLATIRTLLASIE